MADQGTTVESREKSVLRRQFQYRQISYGTFIPYFALDSEYLKSLLIGKSYAYELEEPASAKTFHGVFPPEITRQDSLEEVLSNSAPSLNSPTNGIPKPNFFIECELQVRKLFAFMELHLSKVEDDLAVTVKNVRLASSKQKQKMKELGMEESTRSYFADSQGESEKSKLLDSGIQEDYISTSTGIMNRLREVLLSLQDSLNSSFAALDELVALHDDSALSHDGQGYLQTTEPKRREFEGRISTCLGQIESELHTLHQKDDVRVGGLERFRTESVVTAQVRKSLFGYVTFLYLLLFLVICGVVCYMYYFSEHWVIYLRLVRSPLLVVFYLYLFGFNMKGWAKAGIDYVAIFDYYPNGIPTPKFVNKVAGMFTIFFGVLIVALLSASPFSSNIPAKLITMVMWVSLLWFLINPLNVCLRRGRISFLFVMVRILLAPFIFVYFGDFWFADQLNSTVAILLDIQYYLCYIISDPWTEGTVKSNEKICTESGNGIRPVISCLPALWRFFQCLRCFYDTKQVRHLINAGKYSTTFPVIVFATLFAVKVKPGFSVFSLTNLDLQDVGWIILCWLVSSFVHALYTFIWDVYCDWGLLQLSKGTLLRPKTLFSSKCFYLLAVVFDMILRFAWTLKLTLAIVWHLDSDLLYTALVVAEILRRFVWNFFRVEYEQILHSEDH